jgi:ABC-type lipoprotein release transport system permease subunit
VGRERQQPAASWRHSGSTHGQLSRTIESILRSAMPGAAVEIQPLASQVGSTIAQERVLALLAAWLPARRASRTDPLVVLRHD